MTTLGLCLNTEMLGLTQYMAFDFNSLCSFNGVILGANTSGIFDVSGDLDSAASITSYFKLASSDFGAKKSIRIRRLIIAGWFSGEVYVAMYYDEVLKNTYYIKPLHSTGTYQTLTVAINAEDIGEFVGIKVGNVGGSDFSVDRIDADVEPVIVNAGSNYVVGRVKEELSNITLIGTAV